MNQQANDTAGVSIADRIQDLARKALDTQYECQANGKADHDLREILAVLALVGPVSGPFAAQAHLTIREAIRDDLQVHGFACEALGSLVYELYAWLDEEAHLTFQGGAWITTEEGIRRHLGPEAVAAFHAV